MRRENVDAVRAVYEEWGRGNFRAGVDLYDPLVLVVSFVLPDSGHYVGTDGVREFMLGWLEPWTDVTFAAEEFIEAGDSMVVAARWRAVGKGSGAPTETPNFMVWTFRGLTVIRLEFFRDRADALEAVGLRE